MNQQQTWNSIAEEWNNFRQKPVKEVSEFLKKQKGRILDLGCGSGRHLSKIKNGKMYLVDFSKEMIKYAEENAEKKKISAEFFIAKSEKIPFKNNFFDSAIAIASIHCIEKEKDREKALNELYRVLKPKSQAMITVWNKNSNWFKNSPKNKMVKWREKGERYYYLYDEKELSELLKKTGFKIKNINSGREIIAVVEKN
ncbi:MAG: class I SAM-dependent methyltransferase [Nanoarchaeota archaeon]